MFIHLHSLSLSYIFLQKVASLVCLLFLLHFYISSYHTKLTHINTHSNAKERRARKTTTTTTTATTTTTTATTTTTTIVSCGFFYPLFSSSSPLVRHRHPHQSPVAKTTFLNLPSSSGLITDGKTKKKTKKEKGFHRHHHVFFCDEYGTNLARNVQRFRKWIQSKPRYYEANRRERKRI